MNDEWKETGFDAASSERGGRFWKSDPFFSCARDLERIRAVAGEAGGSMRAREAGIGFGGQVMRVEPKGCF